MKKVPVLISALCVALSGVLYVASAQGDMTPEQRAAAAVDQRKSLFKTIRYNLGPIAGMAQGAPWMPKSRNAMPAASPSWQP